MPFQKLNALTPVKIFQQRLNKPERPLDLRGCVGVFPAPITRPDFEDEQPGDDFDLGQSVDDDLWAFHSIFPFPQHDCRAGFGYCVNGYAFGGVPTR